MRPKELKYLQEEIKGFSKFKKGWDDDDNNEPIHPVAIEQALAFIEWQPPWSSAPDAYPCEVGGVKLLYKEENENAAEIIFTKDKTAFDFIVIDCYEAHGALWFNDVQLRQTRIREYFNEWDDYN